MKNFGSKLKIGFFDEEYQTKVYQSNADSTPTFMYALASYRKDNHTQLT